jgi:DNA-binding SARP family transcriptional activator/tetratricopeptide (TPR) repeat protein
MVLFRVLGPLEIRAGAGWSEVSAPKWRTLLAALLAEPGRVISVERLADELWGAMPPAGARKLVSGYIRRLRQLSGDPDGRVLVTRAPGYQARVTLAHLDAGVFEELLAAGRSALAAQDAQQARTLLTDALTVWRGPAFADVPLGPLSAAAAGRLEELRLTTVELRIEADMSCGHRAELVPELRMLTAEHPLREPLWHQLMRVLQDCARPAEALEAYAHARAVIAHELGADPGPELQKLHQRILAGDPQPTLRQRAHGPVPLSAAGDRSRAVPRQLPAAAPCFTGRGGELAALGRLLEQPASAGAGAVPVAVIGGTAGVGKTALALQWAHQMAEHFPGGQLYLNLRGFDPSGIPVTSAEAVRRLLDGLEVPPERIPADLDTQAALYRSLLADRQMIIVLDNASDPAQIRLLLPGAPGCLVLITSRNQLTGLAATGGAHMLTVDLLTEAEAREFLARRVGTQRVADEPDAVTELARLCAQLPLALSITAARAAARPGLPLATLAAELRDEHVRLDALDTGDAAADIRTVFSWSCQQLSAPAAQMFRLLGVHSGPDISAAAASSLAGLPPTEARQALAELTRAHLITEQAPGRHTLHDLLRTYAAEEARTVDSPTDRRAAVLRVLDHYLHTACAASQLLHPYRDPISLGPLQPQTLPESLADRSQALAWLQAERQVLLAAITQAAREGLDTHAWQLPWAVATFLNWQGYWHELASAQQSALGAARRVGDRAGQAEAHRYLAQAQIRLGAYADAAAHLTEVIALSRELGKNTIEARAHIDLARALEMQDRYPEAFSHAEQSLRLYRAAGHRSGEASALNTVGWCHAHLGGHRQALQDCQQALTLHRELGNRVGEANVLDSLGYIHLHLGHHAEAIACYQQAFEVHGDAGDLRDSAAILIRLGEAHQAAADPSAAKVTWQRALAILDDLQHPDAREVKSKLDALRPARHE